MSKSIFDEIWPRIPARKVKSTWKPMRSLKRGAKTFAKAALWGRSGKTRGIGNIKVKE